MSFKTLEARFQEMKKSRDDHFKELELFRHTNAVQADWIKNLQAEKLKATSKLEFYVDIVELREQEIKDLKFTHNIICVAALLINITTILFMIYGE